MSEAPASLKRISATAVFAPVIDEFAVGDAEALNAGLAEVFLRLRASDPGMVRSNRNGWHSDEDLFDRPEPPVRQLCSHIKAASRAVLGRFWDKDDLRSRPLTFNGWANVNGRHAFNAIHSHGGFHLSGVYFVKVPQPSSPLSGALQFINSQASHGPNKDLWEKIYPMRHTIHPQAGRMFIFPSMLQHWVFPNDEEEERISVAFNVLMP